MIFERNVLENFHGGQRQRVLIARALCSDSSLLILDEPANSLDPSVKIQIYEMLHRLNTDKGITILMISHDLDKALDYCNKVVEIQHGKIIFNDISSKYVVGGA